jgi:hypothetical protein
MGGAVSEERVESDGRVRARPSFVLALLILAAALSLASVEMVLRWRGHEPWRPLERPRNEPVLAAPDDVLGWRNLLGRHSFPGYESDSPLLPGDGAGADITMTIDADGARSVGPAPASPRARVLLIGDSFTMGWAISDDETFGWKLARRFPDVLFTNRGTPGYGAYQSLLAMREVLGREPPPDLVLYGFYDDHLKRNVEEYSALRTLTLRPHFEPRTAPYALVDAAGRLDEHAPEILPHWPLRAHLASVYFVEQWFVQRAAARRFEQAWPVMERIVVEMDAAARRRGARFAFVALMSRPRPVARMAKLCGDRGIPFVDCNRSMRLDWVVVGEGHPNGAMNTEWANCIGDALPALLEGE